MLYIWDFCVDRSESGACFCNTSKQWNHLVNYSPVAKCLLEQKDIHFQFTY